MKRYAVIILFSNSALLVSYLVFKRNTILFTLATNLSYTVFLTTSFFTISLSLLKPAAAGINLSISNLSTSVFKLARFDFEVSKLEVSTCEILLISAFIT